jgi:tetratricopeptide (TPR) repeat protein
MSISDILRARSGKGEKANAHRTDYFCHLSRHHSGFVLYFLKGMEADPANSWIAENLGETYDYLRDFPHAVEYLNKAIMIEPDKSIQYDVLWQVFLKWKGDIGEAREQVEIANRNSQFFINDQSRSIYRNATINLFEGNYGEVLQFLSRCKTDEMEFHRMSNPKHLFYAITYGLMNNPELEHACYDSARLLLERKIGDMPEDIYVHAAL